MKAVRKSNMVNSAVTREYVKEIYEMPFPDLLFKAMQVHREHHRSDVVQYCTLSNIKSGGCSENCSYCSQSARYNTGVDAEKLISVESVVEQAQCAKNAGSTRFCMGAAWRSPRNGKDFDNIIEMVKQVNSLGMETCMTLGMLTEEQAVRLKEAGLKAYNHNLDTSPEYYDKVVTTRTYQDRLDTIKHVQNAGISVCCGGILGLGESREDRIGLLTTLANLDPQPESVPINALLPMGGTPLAENKVIDPIEMARACATARILMPKARVRLSAGRTNMSNEAQALCFLAGANSIFAGDKLLTAPNPGEDKDSILMEMLGLKREVLEQEETAACSR